MKARTLLFLAVLSGCATVRPQATIDRPLLASARNYIPPEAFAAAIPFPPLQLEVFGQSDAPDGYLSSLVTNSTGNAVVIQQNGELCLNGAACTRYLSYDGTNYNLPTSGLIVGSSINTGSGNISKSGANGPININGNPADNSSAVAVSIFPGTSLTTAGGRLLTGAASNSGSPVKFGIGLGGEYLAAVQSVATGGAYTLTPASEYIALTPASAATVTLGETGVQDGHRACITNLHATNAANFADTGGVSELTGAFAMGQYDTLCLIYVSDRWVEISRANN